jgi:hypothetical protein
MMGDHVVEVRNTGETGEIESLIPLFKIDQKDHSTAGSASAFTVG